LFCSFFPIDAFLQRFRKAQKVQVKLLFTLSLRCLLTIEYHVSCVKRGLANAVVHKDVESLPFQMMKQFRIW